MKKTWIFALFIVIIAFSGCQPSALPTEPTVSTTEPTAPTTEATTPPTIEPTQVPEELLLEDLLNIQGSDIDGWYLGGYVNDTFSTEESKKIAAMLRNAAAHPVKHELFYNDPKWFSEVYFSTSEIPDGTLSFAVSSEENIVQICEYDLGARLFFEDEALYQWVLTQFDVPEGSIDWTVYEAYCEDVDQFLEETHKEVSACCEIYDISIIQEELCALKLVTDYARLDVQVYQLQARYTVAPEEMAVALLLPSSRLDSEMRLIWGGENSSLLVVGGKSLGCAFWRVETPEFLDQFDTQDDLIDYIRNS